MSEPDDSRWTEAHLRWAEAEMGAALGEARLAVFDAAEAWWAGLKAAPPAPWSDTVCAALDVAYDRWMAAAETVQALEAFEAGGPETTPV